MKKLVCFCIGIVIGHASWGASFYVSPVELHLKREQRAVHFTIRNQSEVPLLFQVKALKLTGSNWNKPQKSREVIITPPILKIPVHGEQVVRIALRNSQQIRPGEVAYKLLVSQLADPQPKVKAAKGDAINMLLAFELMLTVAPTQRLPLNVAWQVERLSSQDVLLGVQNLSRESLDVRSLVLKEGSKVLAEVNRSERYIFPGTRRTWNVRLVEPVIANKKLAIEATITDRANTETKLHAVVNAQK